MRFLLSIHYMVWLVLSALFFAGGEYLSKKFALNPGWRSASWMFAAYFVGILTWMPAILQKNQLSVVGVIWAVLSLLATVGIGTVIFHEKLGVSGWIGIAAAITAVVLLSQE